MPRPCATRSAGWARTTTRASSTSPTSSGCSWPTVRRSAASSPRTPTTSSAATTAASSPPAAGRSTTGCSTSSCSPVSRSSTRSPRGSTSPPPSSRTPSSSPARSCWAAPPSPPVRSSGPTPRSPTARSARGPASSARTARGRSSAPTRRSARSATCGRVRDWPAAPRSAPSSRPRTPTSARTRRCRTCPTWATPPSAAAPTSGRRRCSSTTTAWPSTTRPWATTCASAPTRCSSRRSPSGTAPTPPRDRSSCPMSHPAPWPSRGRSSGMWEAGYAAAEPGHPRPKPPRRPTRGQRDPTRARPGLPPRHDSEGERPMSAIRQTTSKSLMLFSGRAYPELTDEIAGHLGVTPTPTAAYEFANGELFVRFEESVRGCDAFVVQSHTAPINTWLMEQLIMVDALKRASAKRITVVAPFFPYARQDKKHRGREPISARLVADMFKTAGADRLMTVDLHTAQIQGFFDGPVDHLFALDLLVKHVCERWGDRDITVVSPDSGRVRVAERWTDKLGGSPLAFIHKTRDPMRPNEVVANRVVGEVEGRFCILVDDMIDSGGTIVKAAETLFEAGAADIIVTATHGVLSGPAVDRLKNSRVSEVIVTNTLPITPDRQFDKLTVLSIAPLLARAIKEVFEDGSVTSLFDGAS